MIQNNQRIFLLTGIILIALGGSFYLGTKITTHQVDESSPQNTIKIEDTAPVVDESKPQVSTTTKQVTQALKPKTVASSNTTSYATYTDTNHNFIIKYPTFVKPQLSFSTFHQIGNNWRLYTSSGNQGKPLIAFSIFTVDQGIYYTGKQTYPLYFTAEVRIGTSANTKECYAAENGYPNQRTTTVTINGTPFTKISTTDIQGDKFTQSESYRTIKNGTCFAIEQIKSGSTLKDSAMKIGTTDQMLTNYYSTGDSIIKTFKFTK